MKPEGTLALALRWALAKGLGSSRYASHYPGLQEMFGRLDAAAQKGGSEKPGTRVVGILGPQGSGKSTLAAHLSDLFSKSCFLRADSVSIDDFYLDFSSRKELGIQWRGPPGTHSFKDLDQFFSCLRDDSQHSVSIPVFDKSLWEGQGDRVDPRVVPKPDLLFFEGWFVGLESLPHLTTSSNQLLSAYTHLWASLSALIVLQPIDFTLSYTWRLEAERRLPNGGMSDKLIHDFVGHFLSSLDPELYYPHLRSLRETDPRPTLWQTIAADHSCIHSLQLP